MSGRPGSNALVLGLGLTAAMALGIASAQALDAGGSARQGDQPAQLDRSFGADGTGGAADAGVQGGGSTARGA
ncbi:MAG TPA: hypothetical protein VE782_08390, partial [Myxococcaceae bacterium]|nr:hypothetical protein [Myxococcaceae bacterium]